MPKPSNRSKTGQFAAGTTGNPLGRRGKPRADGWQNDLTGFGIQGRDKTMGSLGNIAFIPDVVTPDSALGFWRGDAIAARIIELIPNEALRQGWELTVGEQSTPDTYTPPKVEPAKPPTAPGAAPARTDEAEVNDIQESVNKNLTDIGTLAALRMALCYKRAYGGGAILIGANDYTTDLREPLDLDRVTSLDWLTVLEPRELVPRYWYNNPRAPKFGQPAIYQLMPFSSGQPIDTDYQFETVEIHESRLLIFNGARVSRLQAASGVQGWGDSVLTRVINSLQQYRTSLKSAAVLLSDFSQAVMKIKGLADLIAQDGQKAFQQKLLSIDLSRSVVRAMVVDAEGEDFERKSTPMSGFPETVDRLATALAADADMPLTLLFGMSPAGLNATGASDIRFFYDRVSSIQELEIAPAILRLVEIALAAQGEDPETTPHAVRFKSLWQPTELEISQAHFTQAQADAIYLTNMVVSPEEIAISRFGGPRYSLDTRVDFDARAAMEAMVAPTVEAKPTPPPVINVVEAGAMPDEAKQSNGAAAPDVE